MPPPPNPSREGRGETKVSLSEFWVKLSNLWGRNPASPSEDRGEGVRTEARSSLSLYAKED